MSQTGLHEHQPLQRSRNLFKRLLKPSSKHPHQQPRTTPAQAPSKRDSREVLFNLHEAEIAIYKNITKSQHSIKDIVRANNSKSSLISQGKFQIYQINSSFNYLTCGSLTHPIMLSSRFIKINRNTFIIPLKNPVRYWRLTLNTDDESIIETFQSLISSLAILKIELLEDYTLQSPFTTYIADGENSHSVHLKSFIHKDSDESISIHSKIDDDDYDDYDDYNGNLKLKTLPIHQPIPRRPNSPSTTSAASSILLRFNNEISSVNTSHFHSPNDLANSFTPLDNKVEHLANIIIDPDLDDDLLLEEENDDDDDLNTSLQNFEKSLIIRENNNKSIEDDDLFKELDSNVSNATDDGNPSLIWNNNGQGLTKRYSLSFKNYDVNKPIPLSILDKYKPQLGSLINQQQ